MTFRRQQGGDLIRGGGTASINSDSHAQPTEHGETPELRETAASPVQIELTNTARQRIEDDLFTLTRSDGLECGGFLFGPALYGRDKRIEITSATRTWNGKRAATSLWLDAEAWLATEQQIAKEQRSEVMLGSWHCHPSTFDRRPSSVDLQAWTSMLDFYKGRRWSSEAHIGLIYSAGRDRQWDGSTWATWARPDVSAWILTRDKWTGQPVCESARF